MKIEPISNGSLRIWLSEEEIEQWGLHPAADTDSRRARRLVRQALAMAGRRPATRLLAEMISVDGGCVLLVSPSLRPDSRQPAVYRISDADTLLSLARQWQALPESGPGGPDQPPYLTLYEREEGYDLAVYPCTPLSQRQMHLLLEYGNLLGCGEAAAAHSAEYGSLLAAGDVLTYRGPGPQEPGDFLH